MENPIKMDDLGVPLFSETSISMQMKWPKKWQWEKPVRHVHHLLLHLAVTMEIYNFCVTRSHLEFLGPSKKIYKICPKTHAISMKFQFLFCVVSMLASKPCISMHFQYPIIQNLLQRFKNRRLENLPHLFRKVWSQVLWQFEPGITTTGLMGPLLKGWWRWPFIFGGAWNQKFFRSGWFFVH